MCEANADSRSTLALIIDDIVDPDKRPRKADRHMEFPGLRSNRAKLRKKYERGEFVKRGTTRIRKLSAAEIAEFRAGVQRSMDRA